MDDRAWMQVAIRPAKPLAFGVIGGTPVVEAKPRRKARLTTA